VAPAAAAPGVAGAGARLAPGLVAALARPLPADGLAIGVVLRQSDLPSDPAREALRRAAIHSREQRVLDALPDGDFRVKRRYQSVAGWAGWAGRAAIEALAGHPEVEALYLDGQVHAALNQGRALIGADAAHASGFTGAGVKVAVLDTGIDTDHPDLSDDLAAQQCFCDNHPSPNRGCCPNRRDTDSSAEDDEGHGTSVAGIITSSGMAAPLGVAPDAEIVAVKVLDAQGSGAFSDVDAALDWLLTERLVPSGPVAGTRVVNLSLGDGVEYNNAAASPCSGSNTANLIDALHAAGVAVFVASGNEGYDNGISFPACVVNAISVGGVYDASVGSISWCGNATCTVTLCTDGPTAADEFVCHSNSDELLDLLAPDYATTTSALGGGTRTFGGTSAASPYAAAEAALLLQANPVFSAEDVRTQLTSHGPAVTNPDNGLAFPRADVGSSVAAFASVCGNGSVEVGEDCDDGGTASGDCCSASCSFEPAGSGCSDGDLCTAGDSCDGAGSCTGGAPVVCDDANVCNGSETCDPASGCQPGSPLVCDDTLFCNGSETCDPASGCQPGLPPATDDGVTCTLDACDEATRVVTHTPDDGLCDDADPCTADFCSAVDDCGHDPIPFCGTDVAATPGSGRGVLGALLLASGFALTWRLRVEWRRKETP